MNGNDRMGAPRGKLAMLLVPVLLFVGLPRAQGQAPEIRLGPPGIGANQVWQITVTVRNDRLRSYDNFPDIDGMRKGGTSTSSQTNIINGKMTSSESVTMTYIPTGEGNFILPPFSMTVNGATVRSGGARIKVGPAVQAQRQYDPFRDFLNRDPFEEFSGDRETEYIDVKEDAFLALTTNKDEVYTGEGFTATLAFYVAMDNKAGMDFYELTTQLPTIVKKLNPANCWEEDFNIENIDADHVVLKGKHYRRYKLHQATFYPLSTQPITFPRVGLEMIKYKVATSPSFFGPNRQRDFKTFYSKPFSVKVKGLPPHPLQDAVAVGNYRLDERLSAQALKTGQSVKYDFKIYGEGNISAIEKPLVKSDGSFDFYEPNIRQDINRQNGMVTGTKIFSYYLVPKEPGDYKLGNYLHWIFFNPTTAKYDTLRPELSLHVTGESRRNLAIESTDAGPLYSKATAIDNQLRSIGFSSWTTWAFNTFILVILAGSLYLVLKK